MNFIDLGYIDQNHAVMMNGLFHNVMMLFIVGALFIIAISCIRNFMK
jgi:hypothetical protein